MTTEVKIRLSLDPGNVEPSAKKAADSLQRIGTAGEASARQTTAAMRQLPAQFTDIATSLAGGQSPLLVLLQQGGQIRDSFGSVREALRGVAGAISPTALGLGALLGGVVAVGNRALQGADEVQTLQRAIANSGATARLTVDDLNELSRSISVRVGTRSGAVDALATIVSTARVAAADVEKVTEAAIRLERAGGRAIADTAQQLAALVKDPLDSTRRLGAELGYLTPRLYEQIKALQEQGRGYEASRVAVAAFTEVTNRQAADLEAATGIIARSWRAVKDAASGAWDAMAGIGRERTVAERLAEVEQRLQQNLRRGFGDADPFGLGSVNSGLQAQISALNRTLLNRTEANATGQALSQLAERYAQAREQANRWAEDGRSSAQKVADALKLFREQVALIRREGGQFSDEQLRLGEEAIRRRFTPEPRQGVRRVAPPVDFEILDRWDARVARLNEALRDDPLGRFAEQQLAQAAQRDDARLLQTETFLQELREANERAGIELLADERSRGVLLIQLERRIAERRLAERGLQGAALAGAQAELGERERLALERLDQQLADRTDRGAKEAGSQLSETIAQGILDGFRNGRSLGDIFLSELKAQFARTVLEPRIRPLVEAGNELVNALLKQLGSLFSGSQGVDTSSPGYTGYLNYRATGGDVWPYRDYVVGERGPEILRMGRMGGSVVPNDKAFGGGGNVTVNVHGAPAGVERQTVQRAGGNTVVDVFLAAAAADVRSGGKLARSMASTYGASRATGAPRRG